MFKVDKYPHGLFSWADGQSTDVAKSKAFYTEVMGWTHEDIHMWDDQYYTMFIADGEYVAGMGQMQADMQAQGIPSHWSNYVNVDDVDAIATRVTELGGTLLMEPMDVFESGRMLFLQDPTGAQLGLWQPKQHKGAGLVNTAGAISWNELTTSDTQAARDFYAGLFGWTYQKIDGTEYYVVMNGTRPNGGIMPKPGAMGDMPSAWTVYFSVADIDQTVETAQANGGNVIGHIMEAGDSGRFAIITDPTGMAAAFIQVKNPQPWKS
jgi:predicted enzyme related to lactoylglutathione lyase